MAKCISSVGVEAVLLWEHNETCRFYFGYYFVFIILDIFIHNTFIEIVLFGSRLIGAPIILATRYDPYPVFFVLGSCP